MVCCIITQMSFAQEEVEKDTLQTEPTKLSDVIVYANKFAESSKRIAQTVKIIKDKNVLNQQSNTGDILINTGSLFVQKSQQGGSSPIIRGFEASRVLLMVDGIRMNNAIYRAGHLQNIITVDNMILDRLEVLYGPSSTLYGSDALGGVINLYTRNPILSNSNKTIVSGNALVRYSTATEEQRGHIDINIGGKEWASLTSVTYGSFGDMTQGSNRQKAYPTFGIKDFIVQRFGNTDSAFVNPNPNKQSPSDYKQIDVIQKFLYQPKSTIQHILNLQFSNSNNVQRYDRLSEKTNGQPSFAEWYYGPQIKNVVAYHFSASKLDGFFKDVKITANYQDIGESRVTRRFKNNSKDFRWERVNIFGINIDAKHYSGKNELHIGAESNSNFVRSTAERRNIVTGVVSRINTRYSDGPTTMSSQAIYAQHTNKISEQWTLNDGLRFSYIRLNAKFVDTSILKLPFAEARQDNIAVTGNVGLVYASSKDFRMAFILSSGFRNPNVDDLSKVFETTVGTVLVPNADIKPEYTYNAEVNFNKFGKQYNFGGSIFYTFFSNAIVVDKFKFNGKDSIIYNNVNSVVLAPQNKAKANLFGFSVNASYTFVKNTTIEGVYTYTYGRYTNANVTVPLDHIPPTYGMVAIKHSNTKWHAEFFTLFNGWKRIENYSASGEDNQQYATVDGMPSWFTLNLRGGVSINKKLSAQIGIENLLDRNYRYFASGISASGINLSVSLKASF